MRVLAVDFGTSNTVAAVGVDGGAPRLVSIDGSPLVPSSVFLTDDGALAVGRDADRQARIDPSRYEPNPKRRIDDGEMLLGSAVLPIAQVIAAVLARVGGEVGRQLGGYPDQVRLTHPARWGQRRRDTLLAAANAARLVPPGSEPVLIPEPVAAATHFAALSGSGLAEGAQLAVYDLGGGTFDVAMVRRGTDGYEVVAEAGLPDLGGLDFDQAIIDHIGRDHGLAVDAAAWHRLLRPDDAATRRQERALQTDVRDGKEALSRYAHTDVALPVPFTDAHLTRSEFEELIRPNLQRSIDLLRATIETAGAQVGQLAGIYLVGGSSRIPLVARMIQENLGVTPTTLDQPETSVATGALYLPIGTTRPAAAGPAQLTTAGVQPPVAAPAAGPGPQVLAATTGPVGLLTPNPGARTPPSVAPGGVGAASAHPSGAVPSQPMAAQAVVRTPPGPAPMTGSGATGTPPPMRTGGDIGGTSWGAGRPPPRDDPNRRAKRWWAAGGVVAAVILIVVLIVEFAHGGSSNSTAGHQSGSAATSTSGGATSTDRTGSESSPPSASSPTATSAPSSSGASGSGVPVAAACKSPVTMAKCFTGSSQDLNSYIQPAAASITHCEPNVAFESSNSGLAIQALKGGTCFFSNGDMVFFGQVDPNLLDVTRTSLTATLSSSAGAGDTSEWSKGKKITYTKIGAGSAIYWDVSSNGMFGLALDPLHPLSGLESWWKASFNH